MATERKHMQTDTASESYSNAHSQNYHDYPLAMEMDTNEVPDLLEVAVKKILPHRLMTVVASVTTAAMLMTSKIEVDSLRF